MTTTSRERFEKLIELHRGSTDRLPDDYGNPNLAGRYINNCIELAWLAWQEAEREKVECVEALDSLVDATEALNNETVLKRGKIESAFVRQCDVMECSRRVLAQVKGQG